MAKVFDLNFECQRLRKQFQFAGFVTNAVTRILETLRSGEVVVDFDDRSYRLTETFLLCLLSLRPFFA